MTDHRPVIEFADVAFSFPNAKPIFRNLSLKLDANAMTLSVGQLQRLCFIRGLLLSPEVLLLDEPTSALDAESARILEQTTENLCAEFGLTVVMVGHRRFSPRRISCSVLEIKNGGVEEKSDT